MAIPKLAKLGKVEYGTEGTFGGGATPYNYLRCDPVDRSGLTQEAIEDNHQRPTLPSVARIPGIKTGQFTIKGPLHGFSGSLPSTAPASLADHPLGKLLDAVFGRSTVGGYVVTDTAGSVPATIHGVDLSTFEPGQAVAYLTSLFGYQVSWLTGVDTGATPHEATLLQSYASAPSPEATAKIHGSLSFGTHPTGLWYNYGPGDLEAFAFKLYSLTELVTAVGCRPSNFKLTAERGKPAMYELPIQVASWDETEQILDIGEGSWTYPPEEALQSGWVAWGVDASYSLPIGKLEFDLGQVLAPIPDLTKPSGIGGYYVKERKPRMTFTVLRDVTAEVVDWASQTGKPFAVSFGSRPGKMFAIAFPRARVIEYPAPADEDGRMVSKITIEAQAYDGDTGTGDLVDTDVRFALL